MCMNGSIANARVLERDHYLIMVDFERKEETPYIGYYDFIDDFVETFPAYEKGDERINHLSYHDFSHDEFPIHNNNQEIGFFHCAIFTLNLPGKGFELSFMLNKSHPNFQNGLDDYDSFLRRLKRSQDYSEERR